MKYRDFLNESLPVVDSELITVVLDGFNFVSQMHIFHLLTKNSNEHLALGKFYEDISNDFDKIAENLLALNIDLSKWNETIYESKLVFAYSKESLMQELDIFRSKITSLITSTNKSELLGLNSVFIDIQQDIDELLFQLRLQ